jgi:N-acetylmuramoyl-L-alanine amidase
LKTICITIAAISFFKVNSFADEIISSEKPKTVNVNQYINIIEKLDSKDLVKAPKIKLNPINTTPMGYESAVFVLGQLRTGYKNHVENNFAEALKVYDNLLASKRLPEYMKNFILRQKPLAEVKKVPMSPKDYFTLIDSTKDSYLLLTYSTEGLIIDSSNYKFKELADSAAFSILKQSLSNQKSGRYNEAFKGYNTIANNVLLETRHTNRAKELKVLADKGIFKPLGGMVIVLDAGHNYGGNVGAHGNGYGETELNMEIVQKLKVQLEAQGARIVLTRSPGEKRYDDSSVELPRRAAMANKSQADLFISIHHDSSTSSSASGSSAFYSSYKNGVNNSSAYVLVENGTYLYTSSNNSTRAGYVQPGQTLNYIGQAPDGFMVNYNGRNLFISNEHSMIFNTAPSFQSILSRDLATKTSAYLSTGIGTKNRGIGDRNLYVTKNTNMASILVEIGFISNYSEITKISKPSYQLKAANEITRAIIAIYGA